MPKRLGSRELGRVGSRRFLRRAHEQPLCNAALALARHRHEFREATNPHADLGLGRCPKIECLTRVERVLQAQLISTALLAGTRVEREIDWTLFGAVALQDTDQQRIDAEVTSERANE